MKVELDNTALEWQQKARHFAETELIPQEVHAEMNQGELPEDVEQRHHDMAIALGFGAMDVPRDHGGLELRIVDQVAVWEQLGRVTNALCWCFSEPQEWMFEACTPGQLEEYILPMMRGERRECFAITETESGSDVVVNTTARRDGDDYIIDGEKWFVTSFNHADFLFVQAQLTEGPHAGSDAMFFVDRNTPGIEVIRTPLFSHTFSHHHPELLFKGVRVPAKNRLGEEGGGMGYSFSWFRRERLMIAARSCGVMARLIEEATEFAREREVSGEKLIDKQLVQAMLADSAVDLWATRLMTFETARAHDNGDDVKSLHVRCSMVKLFATEAAWRVADRAQQIFGGRGYMRENCAERFSREIRVDRIWEGASEIQRLIIGRALAKRGIEGI